jgi:hypothetical protein
MDEISFIIKDLYAMLSSKECTLPKKEKAKRMTAIGRITTKMQKSDYLDVNAVLRELKALY